MPEYTLEPGYGWNPLKRHRNLPCPCGSGRKIKRCHGQADAVPVEHAEFFKHYLAKLFEHGFIPERKSEKP